MATIIINYLDCQKCKLIHNVKETNKSIMDSECRWKTYGNYRLILWVWMMGEVTMVFSPIEMSHNGFYFHGGIYILSAIFIGLPLVYSEICISQYTNCDAISMWNFFPILRSIGYGTVVLIVYKSLYLIVLSSWYLNYTFHAALDPPPWFTCDEFNNSRCMVKRVNTSIFQHCIETQMLFDDDCGMKTASSCFFEREIGGKITLNENCTFQWKSLIISSSVCFVLFCLFLRKEKSMRIAIKILVVYVSFVVFVLFCVALSASGAWYSSKIHINWNDYDFKSCTLTLTRGVLSFGTGFGMFAFLSKNIPFRSPATMTAIAVTLFALFYSVMFALIIYSGIKSMSYFHGEEENVLELGNNPFFSIFASVSEITSYYDESSIWSFLWFSAMFLCLFVNLFITLFYLHDLLVNNFKTVQTYKNVYCAALILLLCLMSCPIFCADLVISFTDAIEIIQLINSFFFSISVYWIYGYNNHNVDIIFMIGVKASYYWKISWIINPILLLLLLYIRAMKVLVNEYDNSFKIQSLGIPCDVLLLILLLSFYALTVIFGVFYELKYYHFFNSTRNIFYPTSKWGPEDKTLLRSRKMFVPEIMTREFLYRQVRIHGYFKDKGTRRKSKPYDRDRALSTEKAEWSALTSN